MEVVVPEGADVATRGDLERLKSWFSTLLLTVSPAQTGLTVTPVVALQR